MVMDSSNQFSIPLFLFFPNFLLYNFVLHNCRVFEIFQAFTEACFCADPAVLPDVLSVWFLLSLSGLAHVFVRIYFCLWAFLSPSLPLLQAFLSQVWGGGLFCLRDLWGCFSSQDGGRRYFMTFALCYHMSAPPTACTV